LLKCSVCGANISIVSGKWRGRSDVVYGCPQNTFRGESVCTNGTRVFRLTFERKLLDGLQEQVMRPEVIDYVLAKFEGELTNAVDNLGGELGQMRHRDRQLGELRGARGLLARAQSGLVHREREISEITAKLFEARPDSLQTKLRNIRTLVETRMRDIRSVLNADAA
jgi:hypothetical protein